jgi:hypothetical protein
MRFDKKLANKSAKALSERADSCFDVAGIQHDEADQQHALADLHQRVSLEQHKNADRIEASADRLDTVGEALEAKAITLKGALEMEVVQSSPRLRSLLDEVPPEPLKAIQK